MVGDSEEADGGAVAVGCRFALVDPLPTEQRPDGLIAALEGGGHRGLGSGHARRRRHQTAVVAQADEQGVHGD